MNDDLSIHTPTLDDTINYIKNHFTNHPVYDDNDYPLPYTDYHTDIAINAYNHICSDIDYYVVTFNHDSNTYDDIINNLITNINVNYDNDFDYGVAARTYIHIYHAVVKGYLDANGD